jgi:mannitol-specific phosphotransferase system IIBC component
MSREVPILLANNFTKLVDKRRAGVMGYLSILGAIPGFFLSSFIFMLLWGVIAPKLGLQNIDYPMAMLITITLWLAVAPLAAVSRRR